MVGLDGWMVGLDGWMVGSDGWMVVIKHEGINNVPLFCFIPLVMSELHVFHAANDLLV